jgi:acetolactate synthase-1/2/3 large subunit
MARMTGHRYLAEAMKAYEVDHIFHMPTIVLPAFAEMEGMGIVRLSTHSEKSAVYMADGYARASGKPGIAMAQTVGAANMAAGLQDPYLACAPVIAITGGRLPDTKFRNVYQEIEAHRMYDAVTKLNATVDKVERLPDMIRQAFRAATTGKPRPVHLELPGASGIIGEEFEVPDSIPLAEEQFKRFPAFRLEPDQSSIRAAARALRDAQRPIIVAGGGVTTSGGQPELVELAELLSIPVATSLNGKGAISETSELAVGVVGTYARMSANRAVSEADLVFYVGSHTGSQVTNNWRTPEIGGAAVIQLDIDPEQLGLNYPNTVSVLGDAKTGLRRLIEASEPVKDRGDWVGRTKQIVEDWRKEKAPLLNSDQDPIRPERLCKEVQDALSPTGVLVVDTGHAGMWTGAMVDMQQGQTFLRAAGSLGWSYPASLGAKCAMPQRDVICFTGDGGFLYHLTELETALRYGINTVTVVNNNYSLNQETEGMNRAYKGNQHGGAFQMWQFEKATNFAQVAEAFGCAGFRVEKPGEIGGALKEALACGRPAVVDVVTDIEALADTTSIYG